MVEKKLCSDRANTFTYYYIVEVTLTRFLLREKIKVVLMVFFIKKIVSHIR